MIVIWNFIKGLKPNTLILAGLAFVLLILWANTSWKGSRALKDKDKQIEELLSDNIDLTIVNQENQAYVEKFNTERELRKQLKLKNDSLAAELKDKDAKILQLTEVSLTFENERQHYKNKWLEVLKTTNTDEGSDDTYFVGSFISTYPKDEDWFVKHTLSLDSAGTSVNWDWGLLPIDLTLIEEKHGNWKTILSAPDWVKISRLNVNSLPPKEYSDDGMRRGLVYYVGGGYTHVWNEDGSIKLPHVSGGIELEKPGWMFTGNLSWKVAQLSILKRLGK